MKIDFMVMSTLIKKSILLCKMDKILLIINQSKPLDYMKHDSHNKNKQDEMSLVIS